MASPSSRDARRPSFALAATAVALLSFGITMLALSAAYAKDIATLASVPFAIWSALCGQPSDSPVALPLLVSLSALSFLAGAVLLLINALRRHRRST